MTTIHLSQDATWTEKEHGAKKTPVRIINGELKRTIGYGPIELNGVFSKEEIKAFLRRFDGMSGEEIAEGRYQRFRKY